MKSATLDLNHELQSLDASSAIQFKQAMLMMLRALKSAKSQVRPTFAERIAGHPAISTWPTEVDGDEYARKLRAEWED
jgi:hypothetical protein